MSLSHISSEGPSGPSFFMLTRLLKWFIIVTYPLGFFTMLDEIFNIKQTHSKFVICPKSEIVPYSKRSGGGTYQYPWFNPEVRKNGGFFVQVTRDKFNNDKGRPGIPTKALKEYGIKYRTTKSQRIVGSNVEFGYYCEIVE